MRNLRFINFPPFNGLKTKSPLPQVQTRHSNYRAHERLPQTARKPLIESDAPLVSRSAHGRGAEVKVVMK